MPQERIGNASKTKARTWRRERRTIARRPEPWPAILAAAGVSCVQLGEAASGFTAYALGRHGRQIALVSDAGRLDRSQLAKAVLSLAPADPLEVGRFVLLSRGGSFFAVRVERNNRGGVLANPTRPTALIECRACRTRAFSDAQWLAGCRSCGASRRRQRLVIIDRLARFTDRRASA
jgi:hypothetical protein